MLNIKIISHKYTQNTMFSLVLWNVKFKDAYFCKAQTYSLISTHLWNKTMCTSFQVSYLFPGFPSHCMVLVVISELTLHLEFSCVFTSLYGISRSRQQTRNVIHWKVKNKISSIQGNNLCTEVILCNVLSQVMVQLDVFSTRTFKTFRTMKLTRKAQYWQ